MDKLSSEQYLSLSEQEKDLEINRAVLRLQNFMMRTSYLIEREVDAAPDGPEKQKT